MTKIKNAKTLLKGTDTHFAQLDGSDTHAASLTGSLTIEDPFRNGVNGFGASTINTLQSVDNTIGTIIVTPTKSTNRVLLFMRIPMSSPNGTQDLEILEGVTLKKKVDVPASGTIQNREISVVLTDVSVSAHTYTFKITHHGDDYQRSIGVTNGVDAFESPKIEAFLIDFDDTHGAVLTGSDTHSASLQGSDTHDTDEDNVIEGG